MTRRATKYSDTQLADCHATPSDLCCKWEVQVGTAPRVALGVVVVSQQLLFRECRCNPGSNNITMPCLGLAMAAWRAVSLIRLLRTALLLHGIQTESSELGAVDDDADGSDAAAERGVVETVEKVEGGEDQSGGRPSRMSWWRRRPKKRRPISVVSAGRVVGVIAATGARVGGGGSSRTLFDDSYR